jgi:hypothetical protein
MRLFLIIAIICMFAGCTININCRPDEGYGEYMIIPHDDPYRFHQENNVTVPNSYTLNGGF